MRYDNETWLDEAFIDRLTEYYADAFEDGVSTPKRPPYCVHVVPHDVVLFRHEVHCGFERGPLYITAPLVAREEEPRDRAVRVIFVSEVADRRHDVADALTEHVRTKRTAKWHEAGLYVCPVPSLVKKGFPWLFSLPGYLSGHFPDSRRTGREAWIEVVVLRPVTVAQATRIDAIVNGPSSLSFYDLIQNAYRDVVVFGRREQRDAQRAKRALGALERKRGTALRR